MITKYLINWTHITVEPVKIVQQEKATTLVSATQAPWGSWHVPTRNLHPTRHGAWREILAYLQKQQANISDDIQRAKQELETKELQ